MKQPYHYLTEKDYAEKVNGCNSLLEKIIICELQIDSMYPNVYKIATECANCGKIFYYDNMLMLDFLYNHKKVNITIKI